MTLLSLIGFGNTGDRNFNYAFYIDYFYQSYVYFLTMAYEFIFTGCIRALPESWHSVQSIVLVL